MKSVPRQHLVEFMKKVIQAILWVVFVLLLCEGLMRLWGIDSSTDRMVAYQFDEVLGWKTRADFKYYRSTLYYGIFNYYNPEGLPTDSLRWHERSSTTQQSIAVLGSSFAESFYVPYKQSIPYQIEKQSPGKQVLNFGVAGFAPDQSLLRSRVEFPKRHISDIVYLFFPYRDLQGLTMQNYHGYQKPLFGDNFDDPINTPLPEPKPENADEGFIASVRHTALYSFLRPYVRKQIGVNLLADGGAIEYDPLLMKRSMDIFTIMKKENPSSRIIIYEIPFYKEMNDHELFQKNTSVYMDACLNQEFTCLSMGDIILKHPNVSDLFIIGDGHVTAYGAKLIADQIVSELKTASSTE